MKLELLPDVLFNSMVHAGIYMMIALCWVIIFRVTGVLNFAVGEGALLGGYLFYTMAHKWGLPFLVSLAVAAVAAGLLGVLIYVGIMRRVAGYPLFSQVIMTMGIAVVLQNVMAMVWGTDSHQLPSPIENRMIPLPGGAAVTTVGVVTLASAVVLFVALMIMLRYTRLGAYMRSASEKPLLASQAGVNINLIFALGWGLSAIIAAIAGIDQAHKTVLDHSIVDLGLRGLAPALIGGMDSVEGVIPGALIVAVIEGLAVLYLGSPAMDAAVFAVLLIGMFLRPHGLFGTPHVHRV